MPSDVAVLNSGTGRFSARICRRNTRESIQLLDKKSFIEFYVYVHVACLPPRCLHALQPTILSLHSIG